ncbi:MAG: hypothetical protein JNK87_10370 [Bryobacterales bacterium]|nr:hypothetical protein [Bryobacterales bacterium]
MLYRLVAFMRDGNLAVFPGESRFRFGDFPTQAFELDVRLGGHLYRYAIEIDYKDDRRLVKRESLSLDETPILKLQEGRFSLYSDDGAELGHIPVDTTKGGMFFSATQRSSASNPSTGGSRHVLPYNSIL